MKFPTRPTFFAALLGSAVFGGIAVAQAAGHDDTNHAAHMQTRTETSQVSAPMDDPVLTEPGQGAFAALSEIVAVLEADPKTDWSAVNLTALRDHLIDMDRLMRDAVVAEEVMPEGLRATMTGDPSTLLAAKRMVPAHAAELLKDDRWRVEARENVTNVVLTVTSDDPATAARIKGLGFFGLMASRDHHREHHMRLALGGSHAD